MAPRVDMQVHVRVLGDDPRYTEWGRISPWLRTQPVFRTTLLYAGIAPEQIDYVNAHAASTPLGDAAETAAIKRALGEEHAYRIPVSSTKSMIGHTMGAAGAIESIMTVLSIRDNRVHPTLNQTTPDPACDLDYVPNESRQVEINIALKNSFGLGGQNAALIFGKYEG